jgi:CrcB protein
MQWSLILIVGIGGFFGAIARFLIAGYVQTHAQTLFPLGTLSVNVLGSFIIGFAALYFAQTIQPEYKALVMTGFLGALTTFSTFALENVTLMQSGAYVKAALNIVLNVVLTLAAVWAAMSIFQKIYGD